jgi:hypothetical protein
MSETQPTSEIARKVCEDIFDSFLWELHPKSDSDFPCKNPEHKTATDKPKKTHPADVVFFYDDPYLGKRIYLHTDMKSYKTDTITPTKLRSALRSMCLTVECAKHSEDWRILYSVPEDISYDVQGLLFVHNHDHGYEANFNDAIQKVSISALPIAVDTVIHFMGPADISRLYSIANDLIRLKYKKELSEEYSFYYPDLVLRRRHGDVWHQPATIELLMSPYFVIKHHRTEKVEPGYLIYYNRPGESADEFVYFLDWLSRFQILEQGSSIKIRICHASPHVSIQSNFQAAKERYARAWGFDTARRQLLNSVDLQFVTSMTDTYNPGNVGWKEDEE